jgi:hypothetical protein
VTPESQSSGFSSGSSGPAENAKAAFETISESASDFFQTAKRTVCSEVEEHPTRTLLIAAGVGLAVGALWAASRYRFDNSSDWSKLPHQTLHALKKFGVA